MIYHSPSLFSVLCFAIRVCLKTLQCNTSSSTYLTYLEPLRAESGRTYSVQLGHVS